MKGNCRQLLWNLLVPLATGAIAGFITRDGMMVFEEVVKPPLSPPAWLFPVVWTILYALMGVSSYLIAREGKEREEVQKALDIYHLQLFFNFVWPVLFFLFEWYLLAFLWLVALWVLVFIMIMKFWPINRAAALLNLPYLAWLTFAAYLNLGIYLLN